MKHFCQVLISATDRKEADKIAELLVSKRFVAGILITKGDSLYWWQKKIVKKVYYNIYGFSIAKNKPKIISEVKKIHSDECPIIAFHEIDGNIEFLNWIKESVN